MLLSPAAGRTRADYVVRVKIPCFFRELLPNPLD